MRVEPAHLVGLAILFATSIPVGWREGPFLHAFHASQLLGGYWFYRYLRTRFWEILACLPRLPSGFLKLSYVYVFWMGLATLTSGVGERRESALRFAGFVVLPWLLSVAIAQSWVVLPARTNRWGRRVFLAAAAIHLSIGFLEFLFPGPFRALVLSEVRWRDSLMAYSNFFPTAGAFEHYNVFGVTMALAAVVAAPWALPRLGRRRVTTHRKRALRFGAIVAVFAAGAVLSTSRFAFVSLLVGLIATTYLWRRETAIRFRVWAVIWTLLMGGLLGLSQLHPSFRARTLEVVDKYRRSYQWGMGEKLNPVWQGIVRTFRDELQGRSEIYDRSWAIVAHHPVKGVGFFQIQRGMMELGYPPVGIHTHNLVLEQLVAGGYPAALLFLFMSFWPTWLLLRAGRSGRIRPNARVLIALQLGFAASQVTDVFVAHVFWYSVFWFGLVALLWCEARRTA